MLEGLKEGNKKAFCQLFELYWEPMFVTAKSYLLNDDLAKDIVQNIWVKLWTERERLEIVNFEPYVLRAVKNNCFKYLRDNKFSPYQLEIIESLQLVSKSKVENQHNLCKTQFVIEKSLHQLSPRCRQIFKLSRIDEYSNEEIAKHLGISKRSVENQVSKALKYIRHNLANT